MRRRVKFTPNPTRWAVILDLLSCFTTRPLNVITGDGGDWTFSARSHRDDMTRAEKVIDTLAYPFEGKGHCRKAYDDEIKRSYANVARHEQRLREKGMQHADQ